MRLFLLNLALVMAPSLAVAQTSPCSGDDPRAAVAADDRFRARFSRASSLRGAEAVAAFRESLFAAEAQCAAGDNAGLRNQAAAHIALGDHHLAARAIDLYLAHRTAESPADGAFVEGLLADIARSVARVTVRTRTAGLAADLAGGARGDSALRLYARAGRSRLELAALGVESVGRIVTLVVGEQTITVDTSSAPLPPAPGELDHVTLRALDAIAVAPSVPASTAARPRRPFRRWIAPAAISAGTLAALGVTFGVWWGIERSAYSDRRCPTINSPDCQSRYDDVQTALGLEVTTLALAGAFAAGAVTLWLLDRRASAPRQTTMMACSVDLPGSLRCRF